MVVANSKFYYISVHGYHGKFQYENILFQVLWLMESNLVPKELQINIMYFVAHHELRV